MRKRGYLIALGIIIILASGCTTAPNGFEQKVISVNSEEEMTTLSASIISETFIQNYKGKPLWIASVNEKGQPQYIYEGEKLTIANGELSLIHVLDDELLYYIERDDGQYLVYDQKEYGPYENIEIPFFSTFNQDYLTKIAMIVGKKPVFKTYNDDLGSRVIYHGNQMIGKHGFSGDIGSISFLEKINDKLAYMVIKGKDAQGNPKHYLVYDGKKIGQEYETATYPFEINGKLGYIAQRDGKTVIVIDGVEKTEEDDFIIELHTIGDNILYSTREGTPGNYKEKVIMNDEVIGQGYDPNSVQIMRHIKDKPVFKAKRNGKLLVYYNGQEIMLENLDPEGRYIQKVIEFKGKPLYDISKSDKTNYILYDGKKIGTQYELVANIKIIDGKLMFVGLKDDKAHVVMQKET